MSLVRFAFVSTALVLVAGTIRAERDSSSEAEEQMLKEAGVGTNNAALLDFLRKRTMNDEQKTHIANLVRDLGDENFHTRQTASAELLEFGRNAIPFLNPVLESTDLEVARRSRRCLDAIESGQGTVLTLAVLKLLGERKPTGGISTIVNFMAQVDEDVVEEEALTSLVSMVGRKADDDLLKAIADPSSTRREIAGYVLGRCPDDKVREQVRKLLQDPSSKVRLRAAQGLVRGKDREGLPALVDLVGDGNLQTAWRAEEMLFQIAGDKSPNVSLGQGDAETRGQCKKAWEKWWKVRGTKLDLAKVDFDNLAQGCTLLVAYDGYRSNGKVWETGPDGKVRWEITSVQGPIDAQVLPNKRVLIAEYNGRRITERDLKGEILWEYKLNNSAISCQRLPNGNTFIATLNEVLEVTPSNKIVYNHASKQSGQITCAQKLRNGQIVYVGTNGHLNVMDEKGNEIKTFRVGGSEWLSFDVLPGGRFVVPQQSTGKVVEYDGNGKVMRETKAPRPYAVATKSNGQYLVVSMNESKQYELTWDGKVTKEQRLDGRPFRVRYR